ncbi:MAG: S-adenosyl-l-methionine hydroxide adenosyltransferase family protein [Chitinophagaceae bacterium]
MVKSKGIVLTSVFALILFAGFTQNSIVVFQSDFGLKDGAVAAMKGVAMSVSPQLKLFDITHEIPAYNIWEAAYRLQQTASYWPRGSVFVSVVDPGVGSDRKSLVVKSRSEHYFVTPDNGTITLVAKSLGIEEIRIINEDNNRLPGSGTSYTFHGRDVFAYTAARLASKIISFAQVGPLLKDKPLLFDYQESLLENNTITANIPILDPPYGNVWTNIPDHLIKKINIRWGDSLHIEIFNKTIQVYAGIVQFVETFSVVPDQQPLAYQNSLMNLSLAIIRGNFAAKYNIQSGLEDHHQKAKTMSMK